MSITKEQVLNALRTVEEPDLKKDLVTLNMITQVEVEGLKISFTVILTTPACPLKELIKNNCIQAIRNLVHPEADVTVNMTAEVTSGQFNKGPLLPGVKNIIAISSGKGGVGKSTVTANLAVALARSGASVGLIDADIYGPSMPTMFDVEEVQPNIVENEQGKPTIIPVEQYGVKIMSIGFMTPPDQAIVWRGPMASSALRQFIADCAWGELDYLIIDLPPGTSDIHLTLVQTVPLTGAIVVTTPQKVALADARKGLLMFRQPQINVPVLGVVENMAWFTPAELPQNKYYIFGQNGGQSLASDFDVPLIGQIPLVQSIRESGDTGKPAVLLRDPMVSEAFEQLAAAVAQQVAIRNASSAPTQKVDIKV
ncbi:MAG: Mrp/NBP35 family ATP-binding protein [Cytophagaceae bacterium]|jgi:ATP-binding protein involved in chromosome partitioning|nr:Mrp/NBP35 family ATP-binding protein [Cytophagaceae bacterium]